MLLGPVLNMLSSLTLLGMVNCSGVVGNPPRLASLSLSSSIISLVGAVVTAGAEGAGGNGGVGSDGFTVLDFRGRT